MTSKKRLYELAEQRGWSVIEELPDKYDESTPFYCEDSEGYRYRTSSRNLYCKKNSYMVYKNNKYSLYNIQHFLDIHNIPFTLIDEEYITNETPMTYQCKRCGTCVKARWTSINKYNQDGSKGRICCPNCDATFESLHAVALKQVFEHEYPDTITEEKSCINPNTGYPMPTDIVNHRLKIAIEIQSQWHDNRAERDAIKREYWLNKGYQFYAPDIREYTITEMIQLFFDIDDIPEYVDLSRANKLNIRTIQKMLDDNLSPKEVSDKLNVSIHRIYDAISRRDLHYSESYIKACYAPVVCFDMNLNKIGVYESIASACRALSVSPKAVGATLLRKNNYSQGYYWQRLDDYNSQARIKHYEKP